MLKKAALVCALLMMTAGAVACGSDDDTENPDPGDWDVELIASAIGDGVDSTNASMRYGCECFTEGADEEQMCLEGMEITDSEREDMLSCVVDELGNFDPPPSSVFDVYNCISDSALDAKSCIDGLKEDFGDHCSDGGIAAYDDCADDHMAAHGDCRDVMDEKAQDWWDATESAMEDAGCMEVIENLDGSNF